MASDEKRDEQRSEAPRPRDLCDGCRAVQPGPHSPGCEATSTTPERHRIADATRVQASAQAEWASRVLRDQGFCGFITIDGEPAQEVGCILRPGHDGGAHEQRRESPTHVDVPVPAPEGAALSAVESHASVSNAGTSSRGQAVGSDATGASVREVPPDARGVALDAGALAPSGRVPASVAAKASVVTTPKRVGCFSCADYATDPRCVYDKCATCCYCKRPITEEDAEDAAAIEAGKRDAEPVVSLAAVEREMPNACVEGSGKR